MEAAADDLDYLPVGERPEWAGVAPRAPPPTPQPVVAIGRDALLGDLMDYFWAAVGQGELSERVLALTGEIIHDLNSSNYTVWEWRWRCVQALGGIAARMAEEKALTRSVATANPKNYQLWNYRRRLALALGPGQAEEEMAFSAACLQHDAKNYHAWAHRQAVLLALARPAHDGDSSTNSRVSSGGVAAAQAQACCALWSAELAFTERLLRQDVRNNSAWNQRIFVLRNAPPAAVGEPREAYDREVDFACSQLRLAPHNESGWEALRGLAAGRGAPPHALAADPRFLALCQEVLGGVSSSSGSSGGGCGRAGGSSRGGEEQGPGGSTRGSSDDAAPTLLAAASPGCPPALSLLADVLLEQAALLQDAAALLESGAGGSSAGGSSIGAEAGAVPDRQAVAAALCAARRLAVQALERQLAADPIKRPYLRLELAALEAALTQAAAS